MPRVLLGLVLALFAGCGGGAPVVESTALEPERAPLVEEPEDERPLIIAFGDSLTAGFGVPEAESYPAILQGLLDRAGYGFRVVNEGISGDTTDQAVARVDLIAEQEPEWVIVEFGGNDGLRGYGLETTQKNLETVVARLKEAGIRVLLVGMKLPPNYGQAYLSQFEAIFPAIADKMDVPLLPFMLVDTYGKEGMIQDDGVHPTAEGNELVARTVFGALEPLLAEKRSSLEWGGRLIVCGDGTAGAATHVPRRCLSRWTGGSYFGSTHLSCRRCAWTKGLPG